MKNKNKKSNDSLFNAKSKKDVIRLLKMGVDINTLNEHGQNALFHINDIKTIDILIRNGININHRNQSGQLAFPNFSVTPEVMTLLIESGLDIHSLDNNGRTLLFNPLLADIYVLLIEAGCDLNHRDHNDQTGFDFLQSSQYDLALAYSIHLKDRSPVTFKHLTYASVELMFELNEQGIDFNIDNQCRLSLDESETKEIITLADPGPKHASLLLKGCVGLFNLEPYSFCAIPPEHGLPQLSYQTAIEPESVRQILALIPTERKLQWHLLSTSRPRQSAG